MDGRTEIDFNILKVLCDETVDLIQFPSSEDELEKYRIEIAFTLKIQVLIFGFLYGFS